MSIFDEVKKDFDKRDAIGYEQWKKELMPDDNIDWLQNAYEEALDLCVYLKGLLLKRDSADRRNTVAPQRAKPQPNGTSSQAKVRQSTVVMNCRVREET